MIDIPLSLRVPPQGRYNRGIYTCYECDFEPPHYTYYLACGALPRPLPVRWSSGNVPDAVRNGCFIIGPKIPVRLTITLPNFSLTAMAIPIGV